MVAHLGDTYYGVARPNWASAAGIGSITSSMEFITITTNVDIRMLSQSGGTIQSQSALNKLLEVISTRGQPVMMGAIGGTTRFTLFMANEHGGAWQNVPSPNDLKSRIIGDGVNWGFGIDTSGDSPAGVNDSAGGTGGGLTVTFSNVMT